MKCKCEEPNLQVTETYSRYMKAAYTEDGALYIDTSWPPDLDDGACDYRLACTECGEVFDLPKDDKGLPRITFEESPA